MKFLFCIITCFIILGCNSNYQDAFIVTNNNKVFIKLKGKRRTMSHNPISVLFNKTYEDSILIQIPEFKEGVIKGDDIPVERGYYKYKGNILINHNNLKINLLINDTDEKKLEPFSWNGEYNLINK